MATEERETITVYKDAWDGHRNVMRQYEERLDVMRSALVKLYTNAAPAICREVRADLLAAKALAYDEWCSEPAKCAFKGFCPRNRSCCD